MECLNPYCTYNGEPEYGLFPNETPFIENHYRCPKCKEMKRTILMTWERIKIAILYSEHCYGCSTYGKHVKTRKTVHVGKKGEFLIGCPKCGWADAGGFIPEPYLSDLLRLRTTMVVTE